MTLEITPITEDWYRSLIDDCQAIITEAEFSSRWALVEGYHELGQRIIDDIPRFIEKGIPESKITSIVAGNTGKSVRTIERSVQFVRKYPDLSTLPEGKSVSWYKIVNKLLPEHIKTEEESVIHDDTILCPNCGTRFKP